MPDPRRPQKGVRGVSIFANPLHSAALAAYPVGSIYMSTTATNPGTLFGGTWERIQGRFLLGADSSHAAGSTGGSEQVTLTEEQLPRINGSVFAAAGAEGETAGGYAAFRTASGKMSLSEPRQYGQPGDKESWAPNAPSYGVLTLAFGEGKSHTNMPPYLAVYCWKRTA